MKDSQESQLIIWSQFRYHWWSLWLLLMAALSYFASTFLSFEAINTWSPATINEQSRLCQCSEWSKTAWGMLWASNKIVYDGWETLHQQEFLWPWLIAMPFLHHMLLLVLVLAHTKCPNLTILLWNTGHCGDMPSRIFFYLCAATVLLISTACAKAQQPQASKLHEGLIALRKEAKLWMWVAACPGSCACMHLRSFPQNVLLLTGRIL